MAVVVVVAAAASAAAGADPMLIGIARGGIVEGTNRAVEAMLCAG